MADVDFRIANGLVAETTITSSEGISGDMDTSVLNPQVIPNRKGHELVVGELMRWF